MRSESHDELDQILDSALAGYSARQPWPGIDERVIARLRGQKRQDAWLRWVVPVPVLAAIVMIIAYLVEPEARHVNVAPPVVQRPVPVERHDEQPQPAAIIAKVPPLHRAPAIRPNVLKAPVFPAPSPLTAEERALIQLAASNPEVLQNAQISRQHGNEPLTVQPINIPPLENSGAMED
jgi:hypothetical protein